MKNKENRPYFTNIEPDGTKEKVYVDQEGVEEGLGSLVVSIFKAIFK